jgi:hypothetical protein
MGRHGPMPGSEVFCWVHQMIGWYQGKGLRVCEIKRISQGIIDHLGEGDSDG